MAAAPDLALLAITVSRVDAACLISLLESHGIAVHVDGFWHASVAVNSIALGGHRVYVVWEDYRLASDLLREVGAERAWSFCHAARRPVVQLVVGVLAYFTANIAVGIAVGALPVSALLYAPFGVAGIIVSPQGRPDYFLAPPAG